MPWDLIIFYMLAAVCIAAALGVVVATNPVHSAIFLVLCFFNVAGVFVMMGAEFLAVIQVIVYTGAILVLLLFVLMLVNPDDLPFFLGLMEHLAERGLNCPLPVKTRTGKSLVSLNGRHAAIVFNSRHSHEMREGHPGELRRRPLPGGARIGRVQKRGNDAHRRRPVLRLEPVPAEIELRMQVGLTDKR